ncbi:AbrB/MazE/SpoVT family DNA-binding domain-containing protein [uncultured Devosia sp.]|uniref:AbrB/MazE/SpoVT family DNA-binding domain-containing protein n=1 Tax=uncultured Devosia sp. TaxID=211434 RepID=UPI0035C9B5D5
MIISLKKFGNSTGVIIPKSLLSEIGAEAGDSFDMRIEDGKIIIQKERRHPREGWAEAAAAIAAAGDDKLVWPEFGNDGDDDLTW